jgi:hypothetical protein
VGIGQNPGKLKLHLSQRHDTLSQPRRLHSGFPFLFGVLLLTASAHAALNTNSPDLAWWRESMNTRDQRLQWWREARFGMFVHWGVYSYLGGTCESM